MTYQSLLQRSYKTFTLAALVGGSLTALAQTNGGKNPISQPLVSHIYTADPSAHVFNGKIYIYPSHDIDAKDVKEDDEGGHFAMRDYHVLSMDKIGGPVKDNGFSTIPLYVKGPYGLSPIA